MWQYTWPDSFLLSPLAGFLRVHLDCGIPWPCFPGLNYWQFSCSCGYRQSRAWTFLTSRGQAHPSIIEIVPLENLEMSERAEVIFPPHNSRRCSSLSRHSSQLVLHLPFTCCSPARGLGSTPEANFGRGPP